jgi:tripartite-type tricarboxylate transporter receptor subunit TctC
MQNQCKKIFLFALLAMALSKVLATGYPDRPVKIVQGFAPGGNPERIARAVADGISRSLNQAFIVEAQTGAGGTIAANTVAKAKPDGYTILLATGGHAVSDAIYLNLPYKTVADFQMISTITYFPFLIVVTEESKYKNLKDLLSSAKEGANTLNYGTAGSGSSQHLAGELLSKMASVELTHIPYRGDAASLTALLSNDVDFIITTPTAVMPNIKAGKLRVLATTGAKRWDGLPNIATVSEQGVRNYEVRSWSGLMAPAGTPQDVIMVLNKATQTALQNPSIKAQLTETGGDVKGSTPDEMKKMVEKETIKWNQLVKDANITKQ